MRGSLERAIIARAVEMVQADQETKLVDPALRTVVTAYLEDDARPNRSLRESCGASSNTGRIRCKRAKGHPTDSDRPHQGFDAAGRRRSWR